VAIGSQAMLGALNDADNNTVIGYGTNPSAVGAQNQTVIGKGATGQADNSVTLGNAYVTAVYMAQDIGAKVHCAGINMSATQPAAVAGGMASETLDHYEEGTFTPAVWYQNADDLTNSTNVTQTGEYTKIGNMCHFQIYLKWNADDARAGDNMGLTGMPFTAKNTTDLRPVFSTIVDGTSLGADDTIVGVQSPNSTTVSFAGVGGGDEESNMGDDFGENDNMTIAITGTYITA